MHGTAAKAERGASERSVFRVEFIINGLHPKEHSPQYRQKANAKMVKCRLFESFAESVKFCGETGSHSDAKFPPRRETLRREFGRSKLPIMATLESLKRPDSPSRPLRCLGKHWSTPCSGGRRGLRADGTGIRGGFSGARAGPSPMAHAGLRPPRMTRPRSPARFEPYKR